MRPRAESSSGLMQNETTVGTETTCLSEESAAGQVKSEDPSPATKQKGAGRFSNTTPQMERSQQALDAYTNNLHCLLRVDSCLLMYPDTPHDLFPHSVPLSFFMSQRLVKDML